MTEIKTHPVTPEESSFIRGITYIPEQENVRHTELMEVRIEHEDHGEMPYYYEDVPASMYNRFISAESYGKFYHTFVRDGSFDREYTDSLEEYAQEIADMLYNVPSTISAHIKNQYSEFYENNTKLVDSLSKRRFDKSVLYVQDNPKFIGFTVEILYLLVTQIQQKLEDELQCELSTQCKELFDKYYTEMQTYVTVNNM